jgi:hypothetical protein
VGLEHVPVAGEAAATLSVVKPAAAAGTSHSLFDVEVREPNPPYATDYAVAADGQRFLVNTVVDQPARAALTAIFNWSEELKARVPTR